MRDFFADTSYQIFDTMEDAMEAVKRDAIESVDDLTIKEIINKYDNININPRQNYLQNVTIAEIKMSFVPTISVSVKGK